MQFAGVPRDDYQEGRQVVRKWMGREEAEGDEGLKLSIQIAKNLLNYTEVD